MALATGARLGPYEIVGALGAGGMGEVYRARDAKLGREVALKLLPAAFGSDPDRLARFEREAKLLAALNHPGIAHLYGFDAVRLEDGAPAHALVMELVPGEDLAERLRRGPLPVGEALGIAAQVAEALEEAHEKGIVHRDLKPANVKVTPDGRVKVLDFGLAKAWLGDAAGGGSSADFSRSPTLTHTGTEAGLILGTAAYMSPEQARGRAVDKRADVWAFGALLFEMLAGKPVFEGETLSDTLAAVIKDDPRLERLPPAVPRGVRALVARCLERDPKLRLRDIGEARIALGRPATAEEAAQPARASAWRTTLAAAAGLALIALGAGLAWRAKPSPELPLRRFELPAEMASRGLALARDGSRIAYVAGGRLRVRELDAVEPRDIGEAHVTTSNLAWSPDGRTIAFTSEGRLRSVPAAGGPVFDIAKGPASGRVLDLAWREDGVILFSAWRDGVYRVPAGGGTPELFLSLDEKNDVDYHGIAPVPGGLVVSAHQRAPDDHYRLELVSSAGARTTLVPESRIDWVRYTPQGYLLMRVRGANEGVWAVRFDGRPFDLGRATRLAAVDGSFHVADDGTLLVLSWPPRPQEHLVLLDRQGGLTETKGEPLTLGGRALALSPDGRRAALYVVTGATSELVVRDLATGIDTRLGAREASDVPVFGRPSWFPSADRVVHSTGSFGDDRLMAFQADGSESSAELAKGQRGIISPDGRHVVYMVDDRGFKRVRRAPLQPDGSVGQSQPLFAEGAEPNAFELQLSPDSTVLAYTARDEGGRSDVFLTRFPSGVGRFRVTSGGGVLPRFSRDGRELFYMAPARDAPASSPRGQLFAVALRHTPALSVGVATVVFDESQAAARGLGLETFDVAPDGRFLMARTVGGAPGPVARLLLVQNWPAALR